MSKLQAYLNTPIPRKAAFAVVIGQGVAMTFVSIKATTKVVRMHHELIQDQQQRLEIYRESMDFLLERADPMAVVELNKKLDYWRVVREMNTESDAD